MARVVPVISRAETERSSSGAAHLIFVAVSHPRMTDAIRLVVDGADYMIEGKRWHKSAFELDLLTDDETPPRAKFRFPNVDRRAIHMLERVAEPAHVEFRVVTSSYFDLTANPRTVRPGMIVQPMYTASHLLLTDITADAVMVSGTLRSWDYRREMWPNRLAVRSLLPGAFV